MWYFRKLTAIVWHSLPLILDHPHGGMCRQSEASYYVSTEQKALKCRMDHVYFVHPSTDVSAETSTDTSVECRPTYRPILGRCIGRYVGRHSTDISTEICRSICRLIGRSRYRSICRLTYRPRLFVRLSADMSIDRLPTLCRYFTHTCVWLIVACVADVI